MNYDTTNNTAADDNNFVVKQSTIEAINVLIAELPGHIAALPYILTIIGEEKIVSMVCDHDAEVYRIQTETAQYNISF